MEKIHALAQHIAVRQPTDAHGKISAQALVGNRFRNEIQHRQDEQDKSSHQGKAQAVVLPECGAIRLCQEINQITDEGKEIDFNERNGDGKAD